MYMTATLLGSTNIADYPDITPEIRYLYRALHEVPDLRRA